MRNRVAAGIVALTIGVVAVGCSSSSSSSTGGGSTSTTSGAAATTAKPSTSGTAGSGGSSGSIPSAAQLQQQASGEGLAITTEQAQCLASAASADPELGTFFSSKSSTTPAQAQAFVSALITCYGSQQSLGQAFVGVIQKQDPRVSSTEATCVGNAMGSMSTADLAAIFANQQSAMSAEGKAAISSCMGSTSTTT